MLRGISNTYVSKWRQTKHSKQNNAAEYNSATNLGLKNHKLNDITLWGVGYVVNTFSVQNIKPKINLLCVKHSPPAGCVGE